MGAYIDCVAEKKVDGEWQLITDELFSGLDGKDRDQPFKSQSYNVFAFLADVRNYSDIRTVSFKRGAPEDISQDAVFFLSDGYYGSESGYGCGPFWQESEEPKHDAKYLASAVVGTDRHSLCHVNLDDLLSFDYDTEVVSKRDGGQVKTLREFLYTPFFADLQALKRIKEEESCDVRVIFCFEG